MKAVLLSFALLLFASHGMVPDPCLVVGHKVLGGHGPPEKWPNDSVFAKYEGDFATLFQDLGVKSAHNHFDDFLKPRKEKNKAHVLDLFGSGFFVDRKGASSVTGMRWGS